MTRTVLFTGFPGFIGRRLAAKILAEDPTSEIVCLVQSKFVAQAKAEVDRIAARLGLHGPRLAVREGDVTDPRLGLAAPAYDELAGRVNEVWHLAAVYDLAVGEELARRVNVDGTRHVLAFCAACKTFGRLVYFSTAYVAGQRRGVVMEEDLVEGAGFKNHYEATKFAAEVLVRAAMRSGLPAVIIRPGIVVGDSRSGETDKFDGPYNSFKLLYLLRAVPLPLPLVGESAAEVNVIPVDFLVDATAAIAARADSAGKTFHVVDPAPLKAAELYDLACRLATGRGAAGFSVPAGLVEGVLGIDIVRDWLKVPREVLAYFNHETHFDATNTAAVLAASGLRVPQPREYFPVLYRYWLAHKDEPGFAAKV